jgi:Tfp pilus assembly PilM family ATPase
VRNLLRRLFLEPEPPLVAIEVRPQAIGVVRLVRRGRELALGTAASLELPAATLRLGMSEPNLLDPTAFRQTLRAVLERAGIAGGTRAALILPDPVVRIAVVPGSEVKARGAAELEELLRFRLKKALPFDVRDARVTYRRDAAGEILAVAGLRSVLDPYEAECRAVGLEPGLVEVCGLALLEAVEASRPSEDRLVVNWDEGYVSIFLTKQGAVVLARTLSGAAVAEPSQVLREVENTVAYYRERLGGAALGAAVVRSASLPPADALRLLGAATGGPVQVLDPQLGRGAQGLGQELAGAAASLLGRVA